MSTVNLTWRRLGRGGVGVWTRVMSCSDTPCESRQTRVAHARRPAHRQKRFNCQHFDLILTSHLSTRSRVLAFWPCSDHRRWPDDDRRFLTTTGDCQRRQAVSDDDRRLLTTTGGCRRGQAVANDDRHLPSTIIRPYHRGWSHNSDSRRRPDDDTTWNIVHVLMTSANRTTVTPDGFMTTARRGRSSTWRRHRRCSLHDSGVPVTTTVQFARQRSACDDDGAVCTTAECLWRMDQPHVSTSRRCSQHVERRSWYSGYGWMPVWGRRVLGVVQNCSTVDSFLSLSLTIWAGLWTSLADQYFALVLWEARPTQDYKLRTLKFYSSFNRICLRNLERTLKRRQREKGVQCDVSHDEVIDEQNNIIWCSPRQGVMLKLCVQFVSVRTVTSEFAACLKVFLAVNELTDWGFLLFFFIYK